MTGRKSKGSKKLHKIKTSHVLKTTDTCSFITSVHESVPEPKPQKTSTFFFDSKKKIARSLQSAVDVRKATALVATSTSCNRRLRSPSLALRATAVRHGRKSGRCTTCRAEKVKQTQERPAARGALPVRCLVLLAGYGMAVKVHNLRLLLRSLWVRCTPGGCTKDINLELRTRVGALLLLLLPLLDSLLGSLRGDLCLLSPLLFLQAPGDLLLKLSLCLRLFVSVMY